MPTGPWWAALITWVVVNLVNVTQAIGFALVGYVLAGSPWWIGPAVFVAFVALMLIVDYLRPVEFRRPARPAILVPYLILFFGSILLMGLSMFDLSRGLWLVTVASSVVLLATMAQAFRQGTA